MFATLLVLKKAFYWLLMLAARVELGKVLLVDIRVVMVTEPVVMLWTRMFWIVVFDATAKESLLMIDLQR